MRYHVHMAISTASGDKGKADKLFSRIIRFHGACERCDYRCPWDCEPQEGSHRQSCKLHTSHVITRHRIGTRCDLRNAFALCASCHRHFEQFPVDHGLFFLDKYDLATYNELRGLAQPGAKVDWKAKVAELSGEWTALRNEWGLG